MRINQIFSKLALLLTGIGEQESGKSILENLLHWVQRKQSSIIIYLHQPILFIHYQLNNLIILHFFMKEGCE